ncbi:hypothetical protein [Paralcaligenes ureilyticus]|uniref:Uncharacterized protein n=1 Tax=Paralcaligenes ureilyticus TaxID=627131 RepID=A0A4R3M6J9_9BURK|nr:hypothetical protein [Paralcaligenes ureilyticus]TCT09041.1 hypothetical protein EDC26_104201 [Paralcaligenes ureilyticus]
MSEARARLDALPTIYPRLFPKGPLPWGFEHGDGWSPIIIALCARLDTILQDAPGASIEVLQAKEKFGGLRFYYELHGADDETAAALREAVDLAAATCARVCERCGRRSAVEDKGGWLSTLCSACRTDPP